MRKGILIQRVSMSQRGFTLIELLVVIAIIGLLASVVLASLNSAREKARDARRLSDIKQLNLAIQLYYDDNGSYPCPGITGSPTYIEDQSHCLSSELVPDYIPTLPLDPTYGNNGNTDWGGDYQYDSNSTGSVYWLRTAFEGAPVEQTATYPNGSSCQGGGYPTCAWNGQDCYYVTGGSCDTYWIHMSQ